MKNFVNHTLAIAICAVALLSSCIKEQPYELNIAQLEVAVTRVDESDSEKQGDGISNAKFWVFECGELDSYGKPTSVSDNAVSWRFEDNLNLVGKVEHVHMELPLCDEDYQNYILVAVLNTDAFGSTIDFDKDTTFTELQEALFDASNVDFWKRYPYDGDTDTAPDPWMMPISNWKTFTVTNDNTHPSNCYKLILPVYRAVAKSQLFVKPTSNNFTVTVTDARICSSAMPQNGAILTSNVKSGLKNNTINGADVYSQQGNAGDDVAVPAVVPDITYQSGADAKPLYNTYGENSALAFSPVTTASSTDYTWAGSTFIYENEKALTDTEGYKTEPTGNNGYYMEISYQVSGDSQIYTRYVALPAVVRNHDYQVKATVDAGGEITLNIEVVDWVEEEIEMNYENTVTIADNGYINWTTLPEKSNSVAELVNGKVASGQIDLTYEDGATAKCTFALQTPQYGTWHAELRTLSGVTGNIVFVDRQSGDVIGTSTKGDITGENGAPQQAELIIRNVGNNLATGGSTGDNVVELRIYATGIAGVYQIPNLPGVFDTDGNPEFAYYRLTQPRN